MDFRAGVVPWKVDGEQQEEPSAPHSQVPTGQAAARAGQGGL